MEEWLSTREAAEVLGISESTVRRLSDRGALPTQRVGRRGERRFKIEHVQGFTLPATPSPQQRPRLAASATAPALGVMVGGRLIDTSSHLAVFYDSDAGRLRLSAPFLQEGLRAGQPCFLIAGGDALDSYLERLRGARGLDLDAAISSGQLRVADTPGTTVDEAVDFWERALWTAIESPGAVIRLVGEMVSVRDRFVSESEMLAFEAAITLTLKRFPCVALCQYDVRRFSGQALFFALRAHPDLFAQPLGPFLS